MKNLEYVRPSSFQILASLEYLIGCLPLWRKFMLCMFTGDNNMLTSFLINPIFFYTFHVLIMWQWIPELFSHELHVFLHIFGWFNSAGWRRGEIDGMLVVCLSLHASYYWHQVNMLDPERKKNDFAKHSDKQLSASRC